MVATTIVIICFIDPRSSRPRNQTPATRNNQTIQLRKMDQEPIRRGIHNRRPTGQPVDRIQNSLRYEQFQSLSKTGRRNYMEAATQVM